MSDYSKIIKEYSPEYCEFLEATYGKNMMSEGKEKGIDELLKGANVINTRILDIGSGLGGVPFHLSTKYQAHVTGIEINKWMVEESARRTPTNIKNMIYFKVYQPPILPFDDETFDIVISKGVLVHENNKLPLFQEIYRSLKKGGQLIINDWLSPVEGIWGKDITEMCEAEGLTLYADTEKNYLKHLKMARFKELSVENEDENYINFNMDIVNYLKNKDVKKQFIKKFNEHWYSEALKSYRLIANSIENGELLIRKFVATK